MAKAAGRTKHAFQNTVSGLIFRMIGILMPFAVKTIIIYKLGVEYLGLNTLFSAILQVLSLSELGFSSAVVFAMYKPIAEGDNEKVCALLGFLRKIYHIIGLFILVVGVAISPLLPYFISDVNSVPADVNLYLLYFIYLFNTIISYFLFAYKGLVLTANQEMNVENNIMSVATMAMYLLQIVALLLFRNYYIYIAFLPLSTIAINLSRALFVDKRYPEFRHGGNLSKEERKAIYQNILALVGHKIGGVVIGSVSNIIVSSYLGLVAVGIYGNYYYVVNALIAIVAVFHSAITPSIGNSLVTESLEKNRRDFSKITFLNVWLVGWMAITMMCLYQHFMYLWVGEALMLPLSSAILFVALFYLWKFKDIVPTFKDAAGLWKADFLKPYAVIAASLLLCFLLTPRIGVNGTLIGLIAGVFAVSMPWETHVFFKRYLGKGELKYYLKMTVYSAVLLLIGGLTYYVCALLPGTGFGWFALKAVICLFLPNVLILFCSFATPEFKGAMQSVKNIFGKNKRRPSPPEAPPEPQAELPAQDSAQQNNQEGNDVSK